MEHATKQTAGVKQPMSRMPGRKKVKDSNHVIGYIFISPFLIGFLGLTLFPMLFSLFLSFTNYDMLSTPKWIGLQNFERMFTSDELFIKSLKVTFFYVFTAVPFRLVFALAIALLLNKLVELTGLYRTLLYLPSIIGGSVAIAGYVETIVRK